MTDSVRTRALSFGAVALLLTACASSGGPPAGAEAERLYAGLSGSWVLVPEESETLQEAVRNAESKLAPEGGARRPRRRRGSLGALNPRGAPEADVQQADRMLPPAALQGVMRMGDRLVVTVDAARVVLEPADFDSTELEIGADARREILATLEVESKAEWKDGGLVVERRISEGPVVSQAFRLADDGRLHVEWTIDTGARLMEFVQVYAPAAG